MDPGFREQEPVGIRPVDLHHRALDPGFLALAQVEHLDREAPPLRPPRVHPHEHLRPILRFGAAGAGADLDLRVAEIVLAREQRLQLERVQLVAGGVDQVIHLGGHARVGLGPQELVELRRALQLRDSRSYGSVTTFSVLTRCTTSRARSGLSQNAGFAMEPSSSASVARSVSMSKVPPELGQPLGAAPQLPLAFDVCHGTKDKQKRNC